MLTLAGNQKRKDAIIERIRRNGALTFGILLAVVIPSCLTWLRATKGPSTPTWFPRMCALPLDVPVDVLAVEVSALFHHWLVCGPTTVASRRLPVGRSTEMTRVSHPVGFSLRHG